MPSTEISQLTITPEEIKAAQIAWGNGLVKIGEVYTNEGYQKAKKEAENFILKYYDHKKVEKPKVEVPEFKALFKPTLASEQPFRLDSEGALSYFVGGNPKYPEDKGFALTPYIHVEWENKGTRIEGNKAITMGNYYFFDSPDNSVKVEYSFAYIKGFKKAELKITLQHSSLPYDPKKAD